MARFQVFEKESVAGGWFDPDVVGGSFDSDIEDSGGAATVIDEDAGSWWVGTFQAIARSVAVAATAMSVAASLSMVQQGIDEIWVPPTAAMDDYAYTPLALRATVFSFAPWDNQQDETGFIAFEEDALPVVQTPLVPAKYPQPWSFDQPEWPAGIGLESPDWTAPVIQQVEPRYIQPWQFDQPEWPAGIGLEQGDWQYPTFIEEFTCFLAPWDYHQDEVAPQGSGSIVDDGPPYVPMALPAPLPRYLQPWSHEQAEPAGSLYNVIYDEPGYIPLALPAPAPVFMQPWFGAQDELAGGAPPPSIAVEDYVWASVVVPPMVAVLVPQEQDEFPGGTVAVVTEDYVWAPTVTPASTVVFVGQTQDEVSNVIVSEDYVWLPSSIPPMVATLAPREQGEVVPVPFVTAEDDYWVPLAPPKVVSSWLQLWQLLATGWQDQWNPQVATTIFMRATDASAPQYHGRAEP